jgi:hypothetical protein
MHHIDIDDAQFDQPPRIGVMYSHTTMDRKSVNLSKPKLAYLRAEPKWLGPSIGEPIRRIVDQHRTLAK